jgi:galactose mutarotase-like enzyme
MIVLRAGSATVAIDETRGARIASLDLDGTELIVGPPDDADVSYEWGCFLMAPWAGRIEDAILDWRGEHHLLPRTSGRHAIHGLVYPRRWSILDVGERGARFECRLEPAGWPFGGVVQQQFDLRANGLRITAELVAERPTPTVLGWHPWFRMNGANPRATILARETLETKDLIPTGRLVPVDERTDLRSSALLAGRPIDDAYPAVTAPAYVEWPSLTLRIDLEPNPATYVVFVRGEAFCVEPQTGWPNAVALAGRGLDRTGLVELEAGERFATTMEWRWAGD